MVIIDTNVIIDFWRNPTEQLKREFLANECCICGVQIAELLYGALSEKDAVTIEDAVSAFTLIHVEDTDWSLLGYFLNKLRKNGITVPFPDALIACIAVKHGFPIWTHDKHFRLIQSAYPDLKLFEISQ